MDITITPSGTLDDLTAINAAIVQLGGLPGTIQLEDGPYWIPGSILSNHNLTLAGRGYNTVINLVDNMNVSMISNVDDYSSWKQNVTIRDLRLNGNKAAQTAGSGIARTGTGAIYRNLWIENCWNRGLAHGWGNSSLVDHVVTKDCDGSGIWITDSTGVVVGASQALSCGLKADSGIGIGGYNCATLKLAGNYVYGGGANRQMSVWGCAGAEVADNILVAALNTALASNANTARLLRNIILNAAVDGIETGTGLSNEIMENILSRCGQHGIALGSDGNITGRNFISASGRAGVHLGASIGNQLLGNVIRNSGQLGGRHPGIWVQIWTAGAINQGTVIKNNRVYDNQPVPTQPVGVYLNPGTGYIDDAVVTNNDLSGNQDEVLVESVSVRNATIQAASFDPPEDVGPSVTEAAATSVGSTSAMIRYATDEAGDTLVLYGKGDALDEVSEVITAKVLDHVLALDRLEPSTAYTALALSKDAAGYPSIPREFSFTTEAAVPSYLHVVTSPVSGAILVDGVQAGTGTVTLTVAPGDHLVSFGAVAGYTTPVARTVAITEGQTANVSGLYVQIVTQTGYLAITTSPLSGTIYVDGMPEGMGAATLEVPTGTHVVGFGDISGYVTPPAQTVTVSSGQTLNITGTYVIQGAGAAYIAVTTAPVAGPIMIDGDLAGEGAVTLEVTPGTHTVSFGAVSGYVTPGSIGVTAVAGETKTVTGTYSTGTAIGNKTVMIAAGAGLLAALAVALVTGRRRK